MEIISKLQFTMKTRNYKLDALKCILIILVIFGHIPLLDGFLDITKSYYDSITEPVKHVMKTCNERYLCFSYASIRYTIRAL